MGKLALITGASSGLGMQITRELADKGYTTIGSARSEDKLQMLAESVNGMYKTFDGTDTNSALNLANYTIDVCKNNKFDELLVIAAADMHEDATIVDSNGKKRYTTEADFNLEYKHKSKILSVISPMLLYASLVNHAHKHVPNFNFVYISSQAAKEEFWDAGNGVYGRNKRLAEQNFMNLSDVYSLRFGFIDTEMADKLLNQLERVEPFVHVDNDLSNPLKAKSELFLPLKKVALDIASFSQDKENFSLNHGNVYYYTLKPSTELYNKWQ